MRVDRLHGQGGTAIVFETPQYPRGAGDSSPPGFSFACLFVALVFAATCGNVYGVTLLPVGPIDFDSDSDYDSNFKEPGTPLNGIARSVNGYLESSGSLATSLAVYDTSATGGTNGQGGTGGNDTNNDLSNFIISADVASSVAGGIGAGFLLRLNKPRVAAIWR